MTRGAESGGGLAPLSPTVRRQRGAVGALFFLNGVLLASWASEVPTVKGALQLSDSMLGLALMALTLGSVLVLPLVTGLLARHPIRAVVAGGVLVAAAGMVGAAANSTLILLALALVLLGMGCGTLDISLNAAALQLEARAGRPLMSGLHGAFSAGALTGALLGAAALSADWGGLRHLTLAALCAVVTALPFVVRLPILAPERPPADVRRAPSTGWSWPLARLAGLALCAAVLEGAVADWAAVYLHGSVGSPAGVAALAFAGFSVTMLLGRLAGDRATARLGAGRLGGGAALLVAVSLGAALAFPQAWVGVSAFTAMGLGVSVLAPLTFSAVGQLPGTPSARALSIVTAAFLSGYVAGPAVVGAAAGLAPLRVALLALVLCAALAAVLARPLGRGPLAGPGTARAGG